MKKKIFISRYSKYKLNFKHELYVRGNLLFIEKDVQHSNTINK